MVIVNEVINMAWKSRIECLIFKVNFEKAYDYVSWTYLNFMLMRLDFSSKWRSWIRACVFSRRLSFLVNVFPTH